MRTKLSSRYPLASYFVLCFVISWSVWIPFGILVPDLILLVLPGAWVPTFVALLMTYFNEGRSGVISLLRSLLKWRVGLRFYGFAVLSMLGLAMLSIGIHVALGGSPPGIESVAVRFGLPAEQASLFIAIAPVIFITTIFVGGPIAEELGWRGYAQPLMQKRIGPARAGLVIGIIWSLWHLPMFAFYPSAVGGLPIEYYIPLLSSFGVLFAWLYNKTAGSVLLCVLFHAGINFGIGIVGVEALSADRRPLAILLILVVLLAAVLSRRMRSVDDSAR